MGLIKRNTGRAWIELRGALKQTSCEIFTEEEATGVAGEHKMTKCKDAQMKLKQRVRKQGPNRC